MRPETGRVDIVLAGAAAVVQIACFLVLYYLDVLRLSAFWRWWLGFL